jgi:alpha-D-ribose 1-methylphosphonate 5-triphosphate synthase subunit PhnH
MNAVTDRHRAFRALLAALAMPGTRHDLPVAAGLPLLLDAVYGERREDVIVAQSELPPELIAGADRGREIAPETGATLYLLVDDATPWTQARIEGPGIRGSAHARVPLSGAALEERNRACATFPLGIDIVAVERDGILAFPRTTRIEALR